MASDIIDRVGMVITTTGTGDVTASVLISNRFNTPAEAGAVNGRSYWWMLEEESDYQIFEGVWTSATQKVSRVTTWQSKIAGVHGAANMNLAGNATLRSVSPAEAFDVMLRVDKAQALTSGQKSQAQSNLGLGNIAVKNLSDVIALTNATDSTSSTSGAITSAGGIAAAKNIVAGESVSGKAFKSAASPRFDPQIQVQSQPLIPVAANGFNAVIAPIGFYGKIILSSTTVGTTAELLAANGVAKLGYEVSNQFSDGPASGKFYVTYDGGYGYLLVNNTAVSANFRCHLTQLA
ncbi:MAG: hypothetical protein J0H71_05580 [Rhizobiales bacterium]|nr:hypothetical protein [Hyphomicrobiales bacterium]